MVKKMSGYQYRYSYRDSRGLIRKVQCGSVYKTYEECDEALCKELTEIERNGLEYFGGDIVEATYEVFVD